MKKRWWSSPKPRGYTCFRRWLSTAIWRTACDAFSNSVRPLRDKFVLALGGEHTVTYGLVTGLVDDLAEVTVVQIDAHADLADELDGRRWSHGTVMRRLWERGCRLVQIGIRSLTRSEYDVAAAGPRITTFYAHRLARAVGRVLDYPPQAGGQGLPDDRRGRAGPLDHSQHGHAAAERPVWRQTIDVLRTLMTESGCQLIAADVVEFVPSPTPPGCDPAAARIVTKMLAWWWAGKKTRPSLGAAATPEVANDGN